MTTVTLSRRGNELGVCIPKDMLEQLGLQEGARLDATVHDGVIVLTPAPRTSRTIRPVNLAELFANSTETYNAGEDPFDFLPANTANTQYQAQPW